jgi:hypothetical protein
MEGRDYGLEYAQRVDDILSVLAANQVIYSIWRICEG